MWLVSDDCFESINKFDSKSINDFEARRSDYEARVGSTRSELLSVADGRGVISVTGVLTESPSFSALLFGGGNTVYADIISAINSAENNDDIREIVLEINSPGGQVNGLFDTVEVLKSAKKPINAKITNQAESAAYAIASQSNRIILNNRAARVGSIGVKVSVPINDNRVVITNTDSPEKSPDVTTQSGIDSVRKELDVISDLFVEAVSQGRGVSKEKVLMDFGKGASIFADDAVLLGMADSIGFDVLSFNDVSNDVNVRKLGASKVMNLNELKEQHPALYAEAAKVGVDSEHDRVIAHLEMSKGGGSVAFDIAREAIECGADLTQSMSAKYMRAALNSKDISALTEDDGKVAEAVDCVSASAKCDATIDDLQEQAMSITEEMLGLKEK